MLVMKLCTVCGKAFERLAHHQVCCSSACAYKRKLALRLERARTAREARAVRIKCLVCGKEFVRQQSKQKFCCAQCKSKHELALRREKSAAHPIMRTCAVCGKAFRVMRGNQTTCSTECRRQNQNRLSRESRERLSERRFAKCSGCGKVFPIVGHFWRYCESCRNKGHGNSSAARAARTEFGLTEEEMRQVAYVQDRLSFEEAHEAAKEWTPKQRKFALARYNQKHMIQTHWFDR